MYKSFRSNLGLLGGKTIKGRRKVKRRTSFYIFVGILYLALLVGVAAGSLPEQAKLVASDGAAQDWFGASVYIDGDYVIIGSYRDDDNGNDSGSVYIFKREGATWSEQDKLIASVGNTNDHFGESVSISGDYAIVGAPRNDNGAAYVFNRDGETWSEQDKLTVSDGNGLYGFGMSVSISGDYAIIGAACADGNQFCAGSAYIFKRDGESWSEQAELASPDGNSVYGFGRPVCIDGDYAIVGAYDGYGNETDTGSAYIFKRDGISWSEQAKLVASDGDTGDHFGESVCISGDYAIIGVRDDDDNGNYSGSAYIFKREGMSWSEQAKLVASDIEANDWFGWSVCISGGYAIVGVRGDDDNGNLSGSAYIFKRYDETWIEQIKLIPSDSDEYDFFGESVSISGDYAIGGADGDDDNGSGSGSAYVFGKCPVSDLDGDCFVDFKDFAVLAGEWLQGEWGE